MVFSWKKVFRVLITMQFIPQGIHNIDFLHLS
jgi:hypothetical protein